MKTSFKKTDLLHRVKRSSKAGHEPGVLQHLGRSKAGDQSIELSSYTPTLLDSKPLTSASLPDALCRLIPQAVTWLNFDGVADVENIEKVGARFGISPMVLEDVLTPDQRPKAEDLWDYLFVVLKMLSVNQSTGAIDSEQVSFVLGQNYLLSFQEGLDGDVFGPVRARLQKDSSKLRQGGPDLLLHALLDAVVDNYFMVLETLADQIESLEDELIENPTKETLHSIYRLKRQLLGLHKVVWPLRELTSVLCRRDSALISETTVVYLRDLYDHAVQALDTVEILRDTLSGMLDIYLSSVSNRMNEIMKMLTVIATIFMPLSFMVGWYGMNFKNMPEYDLPYGYPALLLAMAAIAITMLFYFRRKQWL